MFASKDRVIDYSSLPAIEHSSTSMYAALSSLPEWNNSMSNSNSNKVSITDISNILWSGQGENRPGRRVTPSAGATYPLDLYVSCIAGIIDQEGIFGKYEPGSHSITKISSFSDPSELGELQNFYSTSMIIITSTEQRTSLRYGDRASQYINLEIGHVLENIRLEAWSRDIRLQTFIINGNIKFDKFIPSESKIEVILGLFKKNGNLDYNVTKLNDKINLHTINQGISIEDVIQSRQSIRDYNQRSMSLTELQSITSLSFDTTAEAYKENKTLLSLQNSIYQPFTSVKLITSSKVSNLISGPLFVHK